VELGGEAELDGRDALAGGVGAALVRHAAHRRRRLQDGQAQVEAAEGRGEAHPAPEAERLRDLDPEAGGQLPQRRLPERAVEVPVEVAKGRRTHGSPSREHGPQRRV